MARPPSHSITCLVGAGLAGRSEARASPPYAIEIGSIMQGRTAGDDGLPSTRFTVSTSKAPGRGQVMTGFTVDAVSFRHKFPALSIHLAAGCHPSAHTLHRESQAKPAERVEGRAAASRQSERPDRWEMFSRRHDRGTRLIQSGWCVPVSNRCSGSPEPGLCGGMRWDKLVSRLDGTLLYLCRSRCRPPRSQ